LKGGKMLKKFAEKNSEYFLFVFRVIVGFTFLLHGLMKIPGILNGTTGIINLMFWAGIIEVFGGALIIVGLLTRYVAVITAIEMLYAFVFVHSANGIWNPLANKGEPALLFFAAFLALIALGARKWSVDNYIRK